MSKILIVDDDPQGLHMLEALLKGHGHDVETAVNGSDALAKARRTTPNMIISDFFMPTMDGFALCRECKKDARLKDVPFIAYTATYTDPKDEDLALRLGAARFLIKPIEPDVLLREINQVFADAKAGRLPPSQPTGDQHLREYSESLIRKLEAKVTQLRESNLTLHEEMAKRRQAEDALRALNTDLELKVAQRTMLAEGRAAKLKELASILTQTEQKERRRVAHILHEHVQQLLFAAKLRLQQLRGQLKGDNLVSIADETAEAITAGIDASRSLAIELYPPVLYSLGLLPALNWLATSMKDKYGLQVAVTADPAAEPATDALRTLLFDATLELLFNVVKHARVQSASLDVRRLADQVEITVADTGAGFDAKQLQTREGLAGGFGLFSIRERLDSIGGTLAIRSAPGKGSHFTIVTSLGLTPNAQPSASRPTAAAAMAAQTSVPAGNGGDDRRTRVMLVDDHAIVRRGIALVLQEAKDIEIVGEASDGRAAVDLVDKMLPDVVLMDISMPEMNGIEATRIIHQKRPDVQVIGLSMFEEGEQSAAMLKAGASAYLTKSGDFKDLLAAIRKWAPSLPRDLA